MKQDLTDKIYKDVFSFDTSEDLNINLNKYVKAIILDFHDKSVVVENDNFGTRRKKMCFTEGKKKAGLHPFQIVFAGIGAELENRYVDKNGETHKIKELLKGSK